MTFRHRAGVRPYTSPRGLAESCVFGKQSLGPFRCGRRGLGELVPPPAAALLLPKLRSDYAEFLDHGSPDRLGMLYPPTCVGFGTGGWSLPRGFSRKHGLTGFAEVGFVSRLGLDAVADFPAPRPTRFHADVQNRARLPFSVAPSVVALPAGTGISTRCASATPSGLALAPDSPWED